MLVLGIAFAWAAPARAARVLEAQRRQIAGLIASADAAQVADALAEASVRAATPEAFAAEVVRALADEPSDSQLSPATDALLRALFGRILQAMALGRSAPAVVVQSSNAEGPLPHVAVAPRAVEPGADAGVVAGRHFSSAGHRALSEEWPEVKPRGP